MGIGIPDNVPIDRPPGVGRTYFRHSPTPFAMISTDARLRPLLRHALCYLAILMGTFSVAQTYVNKEWAETIGLPDSLDWSASVFDPSGNIIMTGNTLNAPGDPDVLIAKYDRNGDLIWQQTYGGDAHGPDYGAAVTTDASGNSFIAAAVTTAGAFQDIAVLKYNPAGTLLWSRTWDGPGNLIDAPTSIKLDPTGKIYVAGITYENATNVDYVVLKLNTDGTVLWTNNYDYNGSTDIAVGLELDANNDPVVSGASAATPDSWDYAIVSYNKVNGDQVDAERVTVPGVSLDNALAFTRDDSGFFYITGYTEVNGDKDIQTVRLTSAFTLDWVSSFDGTAGLDDIAKAVGADNNGNVYVAGHSDVAAGGSVFLTIKYDAAGDTLWTRSYHPKEAAWRAEANKLAVTTDGGVLVVGTVKNGSSFNFLTLKYDANGKLEWSKEYDGLDGDDEALDLLTDGDNVYVSGTTGNGIAKTYTTVKYRYTTVKDSALVDPNGVPQCMDRQLLVKFRKPFVNTEWVNKKEIEFGTLSEAVDGTLADAVAHKLGIPSGDRIPVYKVFKGLTTADSISTSRLGEQVPVPPFWSVLKIGLPNSMDLLAAIDSLNTLTHGVVYAQVNNIYQPYDLPNDPLLYRQQSLVPIAPYIGADINADEAWDIQTGIPEVKVGIVDDLIAGAASTGVQDFGTGVNSHIAGGHDFTPGGGGWGDWYEDVYPATSHGTAVAGIVGAIRNNGVGIAGIAGGTAAANTGCSLYSVGIPDYDTGEIVNGILDASTDVGPNDPIPGCQILNASWGEQASLYSNNPTLVDAMVNAYHNQCVFVAARGNALQPGPYSAVFPACYGGTYLSEYGVLNVGASGTDGMYMTPANGDILYSEYGQGMDLIAPGTVHIVTSTINPDIPFNFPQCQYVPIPGYDCFRGTSASAPHVAGVAALMMSEHNVLNGAINDLAPEDVEHIMEQTATDVVNGPVGSGPGYDEPNGWGRLNAGQAVRKVASPYEVFHSGETHGTPTTFPSQTITVSNDAWDLENGNYTATRTQVDFEFVNTFPPLYVVLDTWDRESSTIGVSASSYVDGRYNASYTYEVTPGTQATVHVMATTNCWHLTMDPDGNTIDMWIPASPTQLHTAYSVHLLGPGGPAAVDEPTAGEGFAVYPSPTDGLLNVRLPIERSASSSLDILDITGRIVMHRQVKPGITTLQLSVQSLAEGTYCARLTSATEVITKRFIKH